jgi:hypothetical protein
MPESLEDQLKADIYGKIEKELKPVVGELWLEFKGDALEWAKIVAKLEVDIARGIHPLANQICYDHVTKVGIPSFVYRVRAKTQSEIANALGSLLQFILDTAVMAGTLYLNNKINKLI